MSIEIHPLHARCVDGSSKGLSSERRGFVAGGCAGVSPTIQNWQFVCVSRIWGSHLNSEDSETKDRVNRLQEYLSTYERNLPSLHPGCGTRDIEEDNLRLLRFIQLLKTNPGTPRWMIKDVIIGTASTERQRDIPTAGAFIKARGQERSYGTTLMRCKLPDGHTRDDFVPASFAKDKAGRLFDRSIAAAARAMFSVSVFHRALYEEGERQIGHSSCLWKDDLTLEGLLEREFPVSRSGDHLSGRFKERLVSLRNLVQHADITVVWTDHLPDHLLLRHNEHDKVLTLFGLPSVIDIGCEVSKHVQNSTEDSENFSCHGMQRGSLRFSAEFLLETVQTYQLLIPARDRRWARRTFFANRRKPWLRYLFPPSKVHGHVKDEKLAEAFDLTHHDSDVRARLTTYSQMFRRFPHWGLRIQNLMEEAEDPTPMGWAGQWAERRKGPRHSFWVTVVAFVVASLFGIAATAFGVSQFWVAWCDWQSDRSPPTCNLRDNINSVTTSQPSLTTSQRHR